MKAKKVLKAKTREEILKDFKDSSREEKVQGIVNLIIETDDVYDFLEGFLMAKFPDPGIWKFSH